MSAGKRVTRLLGLLAVGGVTSAASGDEVFVPRDNLTLIRQMSKTDMVDLRLRAWSLFEEVRAAGLPPHDGWLIERDAFGDTTCKGPPESAAGQDESDDESPPKSVVAAPDDLYEATYFNTQACVDIHDRDFPLNDPRTTDRLLARRRTSIDEFSLGAKAIKTFWRPLPDDASVNVGVWQWPSAPAFDRTSGPNDREWYLETIKEPIEEPEETKEPDETKKTEKTAGNWIRRVCVQLDPPAGSSCLKAEDHFLMAQVNTLAGFPRVVQDKQEPLPNGQWLILLAVHVISKESPDWLWATFWWKGVDRTSGDSWTCDDAQRARVPGPWGNFSANVTQSFKLAKPDVTTAADASHCGIPGKIGWDYHREELLATYNPFVEGVMENGRKSSCIACHARANTRGDTGVTPFLIPRVGEVEWPPVTHFEGHIRTDYLWTVRNHLGPSDEPAPSTD